MSELDKLKSENERLKSELAEFKNNPAANFYKALTKAIDGITTKINDESLKIKDDEFVESIIILSEKSEKIFKGLKEGLASFQVEAEDDKVKEKNLGKNQGKAI